MPDDVAALIDRDQAALALRSYTSRLAAILRSEPRRGASAVGSWTLGDVADHLTWGIENYTLWVQGEDAPDLDEIRNMALWNAETVRALPPADLTQLAQRIESATDEFINATAATPPQEEVRWYAGNHIPVEVGVCMRLIEAAVHGRDIAAAAGRGWEIGRDDARLMAYGLG